MTILGSEVKILFRFHSNFLDQITVETMWATKIDVEKGLYKLDSIPFYAPLLTSGDIVFAEYDKEEQMLTYKWTIEYSGNSTVHVVILDKSKDINEIRNLFHELQCVSERLGDSYFALEIPAALDFQPVKQRLIELNEKEIIDYRESSLSEAHKLNCKL